MAGNIRDLRRRIRSVKNTQQITRAMKLVAASKLRKAQETMERARPYASGIRGLLSRVVARTEGQAHPLMEQRDGNRTLLLVVTSDRGLCGSFNANVIKEAVNHVEVNAGREISLELVGRKAADFFKGRRHPVRKFHGDVFRRHDFNVSRALADELMTVFESGDFDRIEILSNRFKTVIAQDLVLEPLLPVGGSEDAEPAPEAESATGDYIYEPAPRELLASIVPSSIRTIVHQTLIESYAAEMGARMVAMETATKNAGELIDHLTLVMNRTRQAAITTEIIEVVSGALALEG